MERVRYDLDELIQHADDSTGLTGGAHTEVKYLPQYSIQGGGNVDYKRDRTDDVKEWLERKKNELDGPDPQKVAEAVEKTWQSEPEEVEVKKEVGPGTDQLSKEIDEVLSKLMEG